MSDSDIKYLEKLISLLPEGRREDPIILLVFLFGTKYILSIQKTGLSIVDFFMYILKIIIVIVDIIFVLKITISSFRKKKAMPKKVKRYLGNKSTKEVHDLSNTKPQCQISEIKNFEYFDDLGDAYDEGYDNCDYCIPKIEEKAKEDECLEGHLATDY